MRKVVALRQLLVIQLLKSDKVGKSTNKDLFAVKCFPGAKADDVGSYIKCTLKNSPEYIKIHYSVKLTI